MNVNIKFRFLRVRVDSEKQATLEVSVDCRDLLDLMKITDADPVLLTNSNGMVIWEEDKSFSDLLDIAWHYCLLR